MLTDEQFALYAQRHRDDIYRLAYSYLKDPQDADDVTQEVLEILCRTTRDFDSAQHVRNWLLRVTINQCKKHLRFLRRHSSVPLEDYAETLCFERPEYEELFAAVMALERKYRVVIHLYYFHGYSVEEISRLLSRPEGTVKTWLARGRQALRKTLREEALYHGT